MLMKNIGDETVKKLPLKKRKKTSRIFENLCSPKDIIPRLRNRMVTNILSDKTICQQTSTTKIYGEKILTPNGSFWLEQGYF